MRPWLLWENFGQCETKLCRGGANNGPLNPLEPLTAEARGLLRPEGR